ncbi:putative protein, possibly involved in nitrogen fixation [Candidatus Rubidus massiliensis]|nr:putative protein, possibly involved in nitrogen fixation [Candidatus Rubidus massiliensis]
MVVVILSSILTGLASLVIYLYYTKKGQFDDVEDVKYQMFRDENKEVAQKKRDSNAKT